MYLNNDLNYTRLYSAYRRFCKLKTEDDEVVNLLDLYPQILPKTITESTVGGKKTYSVRLPDNFTTNFDRSLFIKNYHGIDDSIFDSLFATPKSVINTVDIWSIILVRIKHGSLSNHLKRPMEVAYDDIDDHFQEPSVQKIKYYFRKLLASGSVISSGDLMSYFKDNGIILPTTDKIKYALYDHYLNHPDEIQLVKSLGARAEYKLRTEIEYYIYHKKTSIGEIMKVSVSEPNPRNVLRYAFAKKHSVPYREIRGYKI